MEEIRFNSLKPNASCVVNTLSLSSSALSASSAVKLPLLLPDLAGGAHHG